MNLLQLSTNRALILILFCSFVATSNAQFYGKEAQELNKKKKSTVEKLDSIVGKNRRKVVYAYDAGGNRSAEMTYLWDGILNQWTKSVKSEYTYDASGKMISYIKYNWDAAMTQWSKGLKYDYAYNSNGIPVSKTWLSFDGKRWSNTNREEYIYDATGNFSSWHFDFYTNNHKWRYDQKENYDYDANGNIISGVYYRMPDEGNDFQEREKFTATYNASGNITSISTFNNWATGVFKKSDKFEFTYNANGDIATRSIYFAKDNEWTTPSLQEVYYYSAK